MWPLLPAICYIGSDLALVIIGVAFYYAGADISYAFGLDRCSHINSLIVIFSLVVLLPLCNIILAELTIVLFTSHIAQIDYENIFLFEYVAFESICIVNVSSLIK